MIIFGVVEGRNYISHSYHTIGQSASDVVMWYF